MLHHVTPVTGRISYAQQNRLIFLPGTLESFFSPRIPVHRIVRVLQKIRAGLFRETVGVLVLGHNPLDGLFNFKHSTGSGLKMLTGANWKLRPLLTSPHAFDLDSCSLIYFQTEWSFIFLHLTFTEQKGSCLILV